MQQFVWNLRHSGLTWTSPIRPVSFKRPVSPSADLNARGVQRSAATSRMQDRSAALAWQLRQAPPAPYPTPLARFEAFIKSAQGPDQKTKMGRHGVTAGGIKIKFGRTARIAWRVEIIVKFAVRHEGRSLRRTLSARPSSGLRSGDSRQMWGA
jgi:hypothetical protein